MKTLAYSGLAIIIIGLVFGGIAYYKKAGLINAESKRMAPLELEAIIKNLSVNSSYETIQKVANLHNLSITDRWYYEERKRIHLSIPSQHFLVFGMNLVVRPGVYAQLHFEDNLDLNKYCIISSGNHEGGLSESCEKNMLDFLPAKSRN